MLHLHLTTAYYNSQISTGNHESFASRKPREKEHLPSETACACASTLARILAYARDAVSRSLLSARGANQK